MNSSGARSQQVKSVQSKEKCHELYTILKDLSEQYNLIPIDFDRELDSFGFHKNFNVILPENNIRIDFLDKLLRHYLSMGIKTRHPLTFE